MRVLIIAPDSVGIESHGEIIAVAKGHEVDVLDGVVTRDHLDAVLRGHRSDPYDIIHFIQHGDRRTLMLSDGDIGIEWIRHRFDRATGPVLFVINACDSVRIGAELHNITGSKVIAHAAPITDTAATEFSKSFYDILATGATIHESFSAALNVMRRKFSRESDIPILIDGHYAFSREEAEWIVSTLKEMVSRMKEMDGRIQRVERASNAGLVPYIALGLIQIIGFAALLLAIMAR